MWLGLMWHQRGRRKDFRDKGAYGCRLGLVLVELAIRDTSSESGVRDGGDWTGNGRLGDWEMEMQRLVKEKCQDEGRLVVRDEDGGCGRWPRSNRNGCLGFLIKGCEQGCKGVGRMKMRVSEK
ncbi:unnamed protein product [Sphenostylis stenocarpa]|uniref:Uncharacterized protein n=1 Tax=Sphenostylis stenocarpa TaxID=92480 RepID=A0AA86VZI9_9FABA|nr:unnamed protein product [Sphenostylis stenocarpa]